MEEPYVVREEEDLIFLHKPPNMDSSIKESGRKRSISGWLQDRFPAIADFGYAPADYGLLNRLDYETSGLLVAGKSARGRDRFIELTKRGLITKTYLAVCDGVPPDSIRIDAPIGARSRDAKKVRVYAHPRTKDRALPAVTECEVSATIGGGRFSVVSVSISVGRRHQIRAHLSSIGHPLAGDVLYGSGTMLGSLIPSCPAVFILHGSRISLPGWEGGETLTVSAPVPAYLQEFCPALT